MISIDSCKLRFDLDQIKILNQDLLTYWMEVSTEGEVSESEFKRKRFTIKENGVTTSYLIQKRTVYKSVQKDSLLILFNSKLLGKLYFDGISADTIENLYHMLMLQEVVKINFETFLKGALTDCDLKKDFKVQSIDAQQQTFESMRQLTKMSKSKARGYHAFPNGVQWGKRENATPSCSHVKIYAKDIELEKVSYVFKDHYFQNIEIPPTLRLEVTIKNKKHYRYIMNLPDNIDTSFSLQDVLGLSEEDKMNALTRMFLQHLDAEQSDTKKVIGDITMSEMLAVALLKSSRSLPVAKIKVNACAKNKGQAYQARLILEAMHKAHISYEMKEAAKDSDAIIDYIYNRDKYNSIDEL